MMFFSSGYAIKVIPGFDAAKIDSSKPLDNMARAFETKNSPTKGTKGNAVSSKDPFNDPDLFLACFYKVVL